MNDKQFDLQEDITKYLRERGIKKVFFAEQIGVKPAQLSDYFSGRTSFSNETLDKIRQIIFAESP